jgi:hypothetical protein
MRSRKRHVIAVSIAVLHEVSTCSCNPSFAAVHSGFQSLSFATWLPRCWRCHCVVMRAGRTAVSNGIVSALGLAATLMLFAPAAGGCLLDVEPLLFVACCVRAHCRYDALLC